MNKYHFFWKSKLSNWTPSRFIYGGIQYNCREYLKMKEISKVQDFSLLTNKELIDIKMDIQEQLKLFDPGSEDYRIRYNINTECNKEIILRFIKRESLNKNL